ncbi:hypothetical protein A1D23_06610 [Chelonobacter oris]|uniref:DNA adenine methylase n=1 Tax=Chelonobacter oris TaxID=505317 RepID=UPI00244C7A98|nr:DNA adenine methylase [Chelonobacter oris]MDH2999763.1 hypothetical protein [Chelonobacter oris]
MRYIGSKLKLLSELEEYIVFKTKAQKDSEQSFLDIFAGTASVALSMKKYFRVLTNDLMTYSFHLAQGQVSVNTPPNFSSIQAELNGIDVLDYLNRISSDFTRFITAEYSCTDEQLGQPSARSFFTRSNALKIDAIRSKILQWRKGGLISNHEESYLIACLLEATTKVSNTTGTYGAFLKYWEKRALKDLELIHPILINNQKNNQAFIGKAEELAGQLKVDICYIDPPYNSRQYAGNYHLLETIARYDSPCLKGKTGIRVDTTEKSSDFCSKSKVYRALSELISNVSAHHIFVSYNSDGLLSKQEIEEILLSIGKQETYDVKIINYNAYQSKIVKKKHVEEYIFYIEK